MSEYQKIFKEHGIRQADKQTFILTHFPLWDSKDETFLKELDRKVVKKINEIYEARPSTITYHDLTSSEDYRFLKLLNSFRFHIYNKLAYL
jgi:hypothetical protein